MTLKKAKPIKKTSAKTTGKKSEKSKTKPSPSPGKKTTSAEKPAKKSVSQSKKSKDESLLLVEYAIKGVLEKKGKNIVCLDLRNIMSRVCDYFIICEGDSSTQVSAIADSVEEQVKKGTHQKPYHSEGHQNAEWVLLDYVNVVVHVFQPEVRSFYNLEALWADAEEMTFDAAVSMVS